jgi:cell division protein FtsW (lipid II flippase)
MKVLGESQNEIPRQMRDFTPGRFVLRRHVIIIIIIIVIIIIINNCNWVFARWQWLIYMYTVYKIATKFTSGVLHEKHAVATWNLENHPSI